MTVRLNTASRFIKPARQKQCSPVPRDKSPVFPLLYFMTYNTIINCFLWTADKCIFNLPLLGLWDCWCLCPLNPAKGIRDTISLMPGTGINSGLCSWCSVLASCHSPTYRSQLPQWMPLSSWPGVWSGKCFKLPSFFCEMSGGSRIGILGGAITGFGGGRGTEHAWGIMTHAASLLLPRSSLVLPGPGASWLCLRVRASHNLGEKGAWFYLTFCIVIFFN